MERYVTRRVKKGSVKMKPWSKSALIYTNFFHCPRQHKNILHLKEWFCEIWTSMILGHEWQGEFLGLPLPPPFPPALFSSPVPIHSWLPKCADTWACFDHPSDPGQNRAFHLVLRKFSITPSCTEGSVTRQRQGKGGTCWAQITSVKQHHKHQQAKAGHKTLDNKGVSSDLRGS